MIPLFDRLVSPASDRRGGADPRRRGGSPTGGSVPASRKDSNRGDIRRGHRPSCLAIAGSRRPGGGGLALESNMLRYIPNKPARIARRCGASAARVTSGFIACGRGRVPVDAARPRLAPDVSVPVPGPRSLPLCDDPARASIGYVFRAATPALFRPPRRWSHAEAHDLTDVDGFLRDGGQRGTQSRS